MVSTMLKDGPLHAMVKKETNATNRKREGAQYPNLQLASRRILLDADVLINLGLTHY